MGRCNIGFHFLKNSHISHITMNHCSCKTRCLVGLIEKKKERINLKEVVLDC